MKKFITVLCLALAIFTFVPNVAEVFVPANYAVTVAEAAVSISAKKKTLIKGQSFTLKVKGTKKKGKWSSSNKAVASVTSKGKVSAKKKGTATIKAKVGSKTYKCVVTVETPKLSKKKVTVIKGNTLTIKLNGTKQTVKWSSSDKTVATVKNGKITAKGVGTATITAKVLGKSYTCSVTVKPIPVSVKNISATYYDLGNGVIGVLKNNNKAAIEVEMRVLYYDADGKLIDQNTNEIYCLSKGNTCALEVTGPYDSDYNSLPYSSYKVELKAENISESKLDYIKSIEVENTNTGSKVISHVTNTGDNKIEFTQLAIIFFDADGNAIGYDYHYADVEQSGDTDYLNFEYPYDDNYDTVIPDSYRVYVNEAYSYNW